MKWIGQAIYDQISRFRSEVYLENLSTSTETNILVVDSDGKITKNVDAGDDMAFVLAGDGATLQTIVDGNTLTVTGGTNCTTAVSATDTVTINVDDAFIKNNAADIIAVSDFGATAALTINADQPATNDPEDSTGLYIDYDRLVAESGTENHNDIGIDLDVNSASLGTSSVKGMDIDVVGATSGTHTATGITLDVSGADTNIGMQILCEGEQLRLSHNAADYATFTVADTGDLTIATVGDGARDSDLILDADGQIKLEPTAGANILLDGTIAVDAGVVTGATSITSDAFVGDISGSSGSCTGQAATVATIAGLAPNTATTQATQPNIDSIGTDGDTLSVLGNALSMTNTTTWTPTINLTNTTDDNSAPIIYLKNQRIDSSTQDGEDGDYLGTISFAGYDDGTPSLQTYAQIYSTIHDATSGEESGKLSFTVANHDGGQGEGLILTGGSANNEVDVTVGLGTSSVTTVAGDLNITSNLVMASAVGRRVCFPFRGYGTADGTNYEAPEILSDTNSPFEHDTSYGSDGLTAQEPRQFIKSGAITMPYAGKLINWTGWAASAGSGTIDMSLFKATLTRNSTTTVTPVLLKNTQFTALGNTKLEDFAETSFSVTFSAGDVIYTAVKGSTNNKLWYLDSTLEIEWT